VDERKVSRRAGKTGR